MSNRPDSVAQDMIRAFVDRVLRLKEEAKSINADIREVYAEAKGNGFDKTVLGKLVNYVEKRAADKDAVAEADALFELYLSAYDDQPSHVHAHEAAALLAKHDANTNSASPAPLSVAADGGSTPRPQADDSAAANQSHAIPAETPAATGDVPTPLAARGGDEVAAPILEIPLTNQGEVSDRSPSANAGGNKGGDHATGDGKAVASILEPVVSDQRAGTNTLNGLAGPALSQDPERANTKPAPNFERPKAHPACHDPDECGDYSWQTLCQKCKRLAASSSVAQHSRAA